MSKKHRQFVKSFVLPTLKSGANHIGTQLLDAVNDVNQPADIVIGKVLTALKSGAIATGQEVLRARLNQLK